MTTKTTFPSFLKWGGGNPAVVFLHYFGGAALSWQWVVEALPAESYCVALNLPGFGTAASLEKPSLSGYADYVKRAIGSLGLERFVIVGHSMGGKIALQVAADQPDGLQQVILIAPSPPTQEPMPDEERQRLLTRHPSQENAETTVQQAAKAPLSEQQRSVALQTHMTAEDSAWRWWLKEGMNHSIAEQMAQVQVPVTVVASKDDPVFPFDTIQQEVMAYLPDAHLVETADIGHLMPLERPDFVAEEISKVTNSLV
jgi:pimeloyl-ACP methyl ester carboxylesterase